MPARPPIKAPDLTTDTAPRWDIVALACAAGILAGMQLGKVPPLLPQLRDEFGMNLVAAGWLASAFSGVIGFLGLACGIFADRLGRRRAMLGGLACLVAAGAVGSLAQGGAQFIAARLFEGLGFALIAASAPGMIVQSTSGPAQRFALGLWGTYVPVGIAISMVLARPLTDALGWRGYWLANAAFIAGFIVFFAFWTRALTTPAKRATLSGATASLTRPGPYLMAACFIFYTMQWYAVMTWLPTFAIEVLRVDATGATWIVAGVVLANAGGNIFGAELLRRGVPRWRMVAIASGAMGLLSLFIFSNVLPDAGKFVAAAAFSLIGGMLPASLLSGAATHAATPAEVGIVNGVMIQGAQLGQFLGPPALAAVVAWLGGWQNSGGLLLACGAIGVGLALALRTAELRLAQSRLRSA